MPYGIGPDADHITYFRQAGVLIDVPAPKGSLFEGAERRDLASGGVRLVGYQKVVWHWDFLKPAWYDILRTFCPDPSGTIAIRSTTNDLLDEFQTFDAIYVWPHELEKDSHRRMDFDIEFRRAVEKIVLVQLDTATVTISSGTDVVPGAVTKAMSVAEAFADPHAFEIRMIVLSMDRATAASAGKSLTVA